MLWKPDEELDLNNAFNDMQNISEHERISLIEYLRMHKFYLEKGRGVSISNSEAYFSWKEYVEEPTLFSFKRHNFEKETGIAWPRAFFVIINLWDIQKKFDPERKKEISIDDAVVEFIKHKEWHDVYR